MVNFDRGETMKLFQVVPENFFRPLTSKYREMYLDCLEVIYNSAKLEYSFGVDKEQVLSELEQYFDDSTLDDILFDDEVEVSIDSRSKANSALRHLRATGWIDIERESNFSEKVNLYDYSISMLETFNRISRQEEIEYQSSVSQIYSVLVNEDNYQKPYEYVVLNVKKGSEQLFNGLKILNSSIKKRIDDITRDQSAAEINRDFFKYHEEIGSKAYHRLMTSENISFYKVTIVDRLREILHDTQRFQKTLDGYMAIEQLSNRDTAEEALRNEIREVISSFNLLDEINASISEKHRRYLESVLARVQFLMMNSSDTEGHINRLLAQLAEEVISDSSVLQDEADESVSRIFPLFPHQFLDGSSLYIAPIGKKNTIPDKLISISGLSDSEKKLRRITIQQRLQRQFTRKNINAFVLEQLKDQKSILASNLPLESKRDLIRLIFIRVYSKNTQVAYRVKKLDHEISFITKNHFRFNDFLIERRA